MIAIIKLWSPDKQNILEFMGQCRPNIFGGKRLALPVEYHTMQMSIATC